LVTNLVTFNAAHESRDQRNFVLQNCYSCEPVSAS